MSNAHINALLLKAEKGDPEAHYNLGVMFDTGRGAERSYLQALHWYQKAGDLGHVEALYCLGDLYLNGFVAPKNYALAAHWYSQAAWRGHVQSQYELGLLYYSGRGVRQNPIQASHWLSRAADKGHLEAKFALGNLFSDAKDVPYKRILAYALYCLAAQELKKAKKSCDCIEKQLPFEAINAAQALASEMAKPGNLLVALNAYLNSKEN